MRRVKVLKAVSSPIRLQILNLLFDKGPSTYTELMSNLKMNPSRDAGRFAYHLKFLLKADLLETDVETKKYVLTDLGKMILDIADRVEKRVSGQKSLLVRTSHASLEEFDANKIASSLIREAKIPFETAQKVAKEAEKRLINSKIKYMTAPLVREIVNSILIEKGLEDYRHKLTRLGVPVYDIATIINTKNKTQTGYTITQQTIGQQVFKEYTLLTVFPRDIADAHLSGSLHIENLASWILAPNEISHDIRFFLQKGLNLETMTPQHHSQPPPTNLTQALTTVFSVLTNSAAETDGTQTLDYFNIFLAPYAKNSDPATTKETMLRFVTALNQHIDTAISIELAVPSFIASKPTVEPEAKHTRTYGDFADETQLLASTTIDVFTELSREKPLLNPKLIVKIRNTTFTDPRANALFLKAHALAAERGNVYFANLTEPGTETAVFSPSGAELAADQSQDWEIDTLRTGVLGTVSISLPRIAYESAKDKTKFFEAIKEKLELATRAMEIKHNSLRKHSSTLLPFLTQTFNGDQYLRLDDTLRLVNFIGIKEAAAILAEKDIVEDENAAKLIEEIGQTAQDFIRKMGKKRTKRLHPATLPTPESSTRLAQLDLERFGVGKTRYLGTKENPHYSIIPRLSLQHGKIEPVDVKNEQNQQWLSGGRLTVIDLGRQEIKPDDLAAFTTRLIGDSKTKFFVYDRKLTYCAHCRKNWFGSLQKCPACSATGTLTFYDKFSTV
jgi:ribonucleoside-triphosphate reductase